MWCKEVFFVFVFCFLILNVLMEIYVFIYFGVLLIIFSIESLNALRFLQIFSLNI